MNPLLRKIFLAAQEIAAQCGPFTLFALIKRAEGSGLWDVIAAADWFGPNKLEATTVVVGFLKRYLHDKELIALSHVGLLDPSEPFVKNTLLLLETKGAIFVEGEIQVNGSLTVREDYSELKDGVVNGLEIAHAFFLFPAPSVPLPAPRPDTV